MINTTTLGRPYAKAAFEFASSAGQADAWLSMLAFSAAAVQTPEVARQLVNPALTSDQKVAVLSQVCAEYVDANFVNFLATLSSNDRLSLLPVVLEQFTALKAKAESTLDVEVQTAFELTAEQLTTLAAALSKRLDRTVQPKPVVNPALIGGLLIRAGDLVIDSSVRGKLNKLAEALKS
ncbi:MAG: F0F1 ATP synthase subunit delta [Gammaproteobacteria bacterium]|jgi:F-type H+-transporting ATPase subunit delta|nr:F0F1 ATP synthase subunit delta [Gammaproteobacteria bacterium]MBU1490367.1 F0F1 ATP synthase subunit delta [Gammaproteobacteria bacterium]MBU2066358.1 F0F1 ATP synthase subunit delta [Gammaproteobacteria bacterium]MBU2139744.1 F0F1 ATP synthase subunit delta [Gammaproteobacteria bacterium]MBU2215970.1 F0F1 ATP synthase subunit delta [Gammaproteobacteria bacterium]